uniref:Uncharacterized protein n=1 Tax=Oryza sativa subsp. japonica TaxID=39947 RepID=Q6H4Z7_ORYSJ|nr:hypothetical protein [Oryza sativa Japonica Group]BAD26202.1 hypothetical protein [Oryza sativa Japonica Group]
MATLKKDVADLKVLKAFYSTSHGRKEGEGEEMIEGEERRGVEEEEEEEEEEKKKIRGGRIRGGNFPIGPGDPVETHPYGGGGGWNFRPTASAAQADAPMELSRGRHIQLGVAGPRSPAGPLRVRGPVRFSTWSTMWGWGRGRKARSGAGGILAQPVHTPPRPIVTLRGMQERGCGG